MKIGVQLNMVSIVSQDKVKSRKEECLELAVKVKRA